jgi:hypothetical protein
MQMWSQNGYDIRQQQRIICGGAELWYSGILMVAILELNAMANGEMSALLTLPNRNGTM